MENVTSNLTLNLKGSQRLQLVSLLGLLAGNAAQLRRIWDLQNKLDLDENEKAAIGYRTLVHQGVETGAWDAARDIDAKDFEITPAEKLHLVRAFNELTLPANARQWVLPILDLVVPDQN